jgi:hypothetical protein
VWRKELAGLKVRLYEPVFKLISQIQYDVQIVVVFKQLNKKYVANSAAAF